MKTLAKTALHALAAVSLCGAAVTPVLAQERVQSRIDVTYADLDLATAEGQKALDQRVEKAVRSVCRTTRFEGGTRLMSPDALTCLAKARANARQQVAAIVNSEQRGG